MSKKKPKASRKRPAAEARAHLYYTGRVQGVGFRYTAESIAQELKLTGWVRNLPDGGVELVCEGPKAQIEALMERISRSAVGAHIKKCNCGWEAPTDEFDDFRVEFIY